MRRRFTSLVLALFLGVAAAFPSAAAEPAPLRLVLIPQENPEKLIGDLKAIGDYLTGEIGVPVQGFVAHDHAAAIEALAADKADISFLGALPAVMARARTGAEIVLSEVYRGKPRYTAAVFVSQKSTAATLGDLKNKTIAFADPISESGYLYPLELFVAGGHLKRDADPARFFRRVFFAGGYQQAIQAVANGLVDAAGVSIYAPLLLPPADRANVRMLAETASIPSHAVIARKGLATDRRDAFVRAMLKLNDPEHRHLLKHVYGPDGYVAADKAAYDAVAALARHYGLIR